MHRTGPLAAGGGCFRRLRRTCGRCGAHVFQRLGFEFSATAGAAEEIRMAFECGAMRGLLRIDRHPADGVFRESAFGAVLLRRRMAVRIVMVAMRMRVTARHGHLHSLPNSAREAYLSGGAQDI